MRKSICIGTVVFIMSFVLGFVNVQAATNYKKTLPTSGFTTNDIMIYLDQNFTKPEMELEKFTQVSVLSVGKVYKIFYKDQICFANSKDIFISDDLNLVKLLYEQPVTPELVTNEYVCSLFQNYIQDIKLTSPNKYFIYTNLTSFTSFLCEVKTNEQNENYVSIEMSFPITHGASNTPTLTGDFFIYRKTPVWSYPTNNVVYPMNFFYGYATHSRIVSKSNKYTPLDAGTGKLLSHGCIRADTANAERLYSLAPIGTPVFVSY